MRNDFTAVFEVAEEGGFVAYAEELPGAISQGETIEEARENLADAIQLLLAANRELYRQDHADGSVIRETITVTS
jgi:predicted RNase H-like HicB family nuclease